MKPRTFLLIVFRRCHCLCGLTSRVLTSHGQAVKNVIAKNVGHLWRFQSPYHPIQPCPLSCNMSREVHEILSSQDRSNYSGNSIASESRALKYTYVGWENKPSTAGDKTLAPMVEIRWTDIRKVVALTWVTPTGRSRTWCHSGICYENQKMPHSSLPPSQRSEIASTECPIHHMVPSFVQ